MVQIPITISKDSDIQKVGKSYDLYLKRVTLLLVNFCKSFRKMCLEIYELDPSKYFSVLD